MAAPLDLIAARKSLTDELGESSIVYFQNLASWFKKKTSKEDFDLQARRLLKSDAVHLHNEFLLAIIAKCQSVSSSMVMSKEAALQSASTSPSKLQKDASSKLKRKQSGSHRANMQQRFVSVNPLQYAPKISSKPVEESTSSLGFVSRDMLLPDIALIHGRALVCAWEMGLQDVQDSVVRLVVHALEIQVKKILSAVMQKRSGYKVREGRMRFSMGCQVKNPYLRQTAITHDTSLNSEATTITNSGYHTPSLKPSVDVAEQAAAHEIALADRPPVYRPPISMFDLLETLQLNRSVIPSHSVYSPALERVIHGLWHPDPEEEVPSASRRECDPDPLPPRKPRPAVNTWLWL
ncbi:hypothetical protein V1264_006634 [Littorina saxatilis]|uniref:Transcriptional adapter 1 n=2 Tax=Littorina saxatilis TaxID=31220 RepID=A0AAN9AY49_9CAEN